MPDYEPGYSERWEHEQQAHVHTPDKTTTNKSFVEFISEDLDPYMPDWMGDDA